MDDLSLLVNELPESLRVRHEFLLGSHFIVGSTLLAHRFTATVESFVVVMQWQRILFQRRSLGSQNSS